MAKRSSSFPERPSLEQYRNQAKDLVKTHHTGDPTAAQRVSRALPRRAAGRPLALSEAQRVVAIEHGYPSWLRFKGEVTARAAASAPREGDAVVVTNGPFAGQRGRVAGLAVQRSELIVSLDLGPRVWLEPGFVSRC